MKKHFASLLVGLLVIFCNNVYADVFMGEWRLFVKSDGTEIADNAPSVRLKVSKVGDFYNVLVILPEANRDLEAMRREFTGKYVLSDDGKTIEHLSGGASFKYRKTGNMICSGKDMLKGNISHNLGCFRHVKADTNPTTQIETDTLPYNLAVLNYQEMQTKGTDPYVYKSFGEFAGVRYDEAWSALIADLGSKKSGLTIRIQNKNLGRIQAVAGGDDNSFTLNIKLTKMKKRLATMQSRIRMDIQFNSKLAIVEGEGNSRDNIIEEFAMLMDIVRNTNHQSAAMHRKITLSDETLSDQGKIEKISRTAQNIRASVQVYYGDNNKFPKNLAELTIGAKYMSRIPYEPMTGSNKVTVSDAEFQSHNTKEFAPYITDEGGWLYFAKKGDVCVNISAKDSRGIELYKY